MPRNAKARWTPVALVLALALLPAAVARGGEFEAGRYPAAISGSGESHVFGVEKEKLVTCKGVSYSGELLEQKGTVQFSPTYTECSAFGFVVTVATNGCVYELSPGEEGAEYEFGGSKGIVCPAGKAMVISGGTCEVQVGTQSGLGKVAYHDKVGEEVSDLALEESLTKIKLTVVKDGIFCPLAGTGERTEGTYSGTSTFTGLFEGAEEVGFAIEQNVPTKLCTQNPKPATACAAGEAYKDASLVFLAEEPAQETVLKIMEKPTTIKNELKCEESKITGTSKGEVGNPLPLEKFTAAFTTCVNSAGKTCDSVTMENAPATMSIATSVALPRSGAVYGPVTLRIKCKGEVECRYKSDKFPMSIFGATVAVFDVGDSIMEKWALGGGQDLNCYDRLIWRAAYPIVKPGPLWVTR